MEPIVTVTTSTDVLTFTGTDLEAGLVYDNDFLDSWLALAEVDVKLNKRPNGHGTYDPDQLFTVEKRIKFPGRFFGSTISEASYMRDRLAGMFADGRSVILSVEDAVGVSSRTAYLVAFEPEWMPDGNFSFEAEFAAPDPRRYGILHELSTGLPTASSGLVFPLFSTAGGTWDWGTVGATGRVEIVNAGNTTTYPIILVGDGGDLLAGFELTEVDTGRTITYPVGTDGGIVSINNRTHRATLSGGEVTGNLTRREWFAVPPGESYEYQFVTLGGTTGTPTMHVFAADAYL